MGEQQPGHSNPEKKQGDQRSFCYPQWQGTPGTNWWWGQGKGKVCVRSTIQISYLNEITLLLHRRMQPGKALSKADEPSWGRFHRMMPVCSPGRVILSEVGTDRVLSKRRQHFGVRLLERHLRGLTHKNILMLGT